MKVEYLIVVEEKDSNGFCSNKETFLNLLQTDARISVKNNKLIWSDAKSNLEIYINVETDIIKDKNQRYFLIELWIDNKSRIEEFTQVTKAIKQIARKLEVEAYSFNTLWNDISNYYSEQSYPLINNIENLMRKLISKFMVITIGRSWVSENIPEKVKQKINTNEKRNELLSDILHNADFIDLSNFLFEKYRKKDITQLDNYIASTKDENISIEVLKQDYYPKSNWDKYFSKIVNTKGDVLKKDWDKLYELRNKIAHNKLIEKGDYDIIQDLTQSVGGKLEEAINKLSTIKLTEEEKNEVLTNIDHSIKIADTYIRNAVIEWYMNNTLFKATSTPSRLRNSRIIADFDIVLEDGTTIIGEIKYYPSNVHITSSTLFNGINHFIANSPHSDGLHYVIVYGNKPDIYLINTLTKTRELIQGNELNIELIVTYLENNKLVTLEGFVPGCFIYNR